jgi:uncharacterized membrane protein
MLTKSVVAATLLAAVALPAVGLPTAHAGDDEKVRRGQCTGTADWKLKVKTDDGGLEVEAEVDSNVDGQTWKWVLRHDGDVVDRGRSQTRGPSGSFDVERRTSDGAGTDAVRFRAQHGDQVCVGRLRY